MKTKERDEAILLTLRTLEGVSEDITTLTAVLQADREALRAELLSIKVRLDRVELHTGLRGMK